MLRWLVGIALLLLIAITTTSAYIRINLSGLGCSDWPQCYRLAQAAGGVAADVGIARALHRVLASLAGVWLIVLLVLGWGELRHRGARGIALALVLLAALLAWLGMATPSAFPAVTLGNLLGGMLMLACAAWLWGWCSAAASRSYPCGATAGQRAAASGTVRGTLALALALVFLQMALGGMLGARGAATACPELPLCAAGWPDRGTAWAVFWPFVPDAQLQDAAALASGFAALHDAHRLLALVLAAATAWAAWTVTRSSGIGSTRRCSSGMTPPDAAPVWAAFALVLALGIVGGLLVALDYPIALALAHNLLSALLVVALASALGSAGSARSAGTASGAGPG